MPAILLMLRPYLKYVGILIGVVLLYLWYQSYISDIKKDAFKTGHAAAIEETRLGLENTNADNRAREQRINDQVFDFAKTMLAKDTSRIEHERIVQTQLAPLIAKQADCAISPEIIEQINQLR